VVPLGVLNQADVPVSSGAFLEGQPSVVRAVYATGICDFGATFIDARTSPTLEVSYPDVMDKVRVIYRIPPVIPYDHVVFASSVPIEMRRVLLRALVDVMGTPEGRASMQTIYGIEDLQPVEDAVYAPFRDFVKASGLTADELLIQP
jgi:ABC-type phosphate/phosphonate transport system substrate-binding protein